MEYPWGTEQDDDIWEQDVKDYLKSEGILVARAEVGHMGGYVCAACEICPTGRYIQVWICEEDSNQIELLGFGRFGFES